MDHTISTRWGGRAWRYVGFKGAVGRCFDPYARHPVEFEFAHEYEAWLRWRFDPETQSISHKSSLLCVSKNGFDLQGQPTFVVTDRNGQLHYHLVVGNRNPERRKRALDRVAAITGAKVHVTNREELRKNVELFWRLEMLRQASQLHEGEGADIEPEIVAAVRCGADTLKTICAQLHHLQTQFLVARLGHLHCAGRVILDFCRDDFGVRLIAGGDQ